MEELFGPLAAAGEVMMEQLGMAIGLTREGSELFGFDLGDIGPLGVDTELARQKLSSKRAEELLKTGYLRSLEMLRQLGADEDQINTRIEAIESMGPGQIQELIRLSEDSRFASLSISTRQGNMMASNITSVQRSFMRSISSSEIDSFYFRRQGTLVPNRLNQLAEDLDESFIADMRQIEEFKNNRSLAETMEGQAKIRVSEEMVSQKYIERLRTATQEMRNIEGYEDFDVLDLADAITRVERDRGAAGSGMGHVRMSLMGGIGPYRTR